MKLAIDIAALRSAVRNDKRCMDLIESETRGLPTPVGVIRTVVGSVLTGVGGVMSKAGEATKPARAKAPK